MAGGGGEPGGSGHPTDAGARLPSADTAGRRRPTPTPPRGASPRRRGYIVIPVGPPAPAFPPIGQRGFASRMHGPAPAFPCIGQQSFA
jgi:hypothetical protein